jgi:hypothetical protein
MNARSVQHAGAGAASQAVTRAAEAVASGQRGDVRVLTGLRLADRDTGQWMALDLVVLTSTAVVVGVEAGAAIAANTAPQAAALAVARLQRDRLIAPPLPVYAFWLGTAVPAGYSGAAPALAEPEAVRRFVEQASAQGVPPAAQAAERLAELLLEARVAPAGLPGERHAGDSRGQPAAALHRQTWHGLRALLAGLDAGLRAFIRRPLAGRRRRELRPADVRERLEAAMLKPENILEDARYHRIVPNDYTVLIHPATYERHFRQIERRVCEQWREELVTALDTANQRRGRRQFQFGGPVQVRVLADEAVPEGDARINSQIVAEPGQANGAACLELPASGRRWPLAGGRLTIGRDESSDIYLPAPPGQRRPLISGQHAYVLMEAGAARLFDGSPAGRPSLNGTFVNGRRVGPGGQMLEDGDLIVLAPLDPDNPQPDAAGSVALRFHARCRQ